MDDNDGARNRGLPSLGPKGEGWVALQFVIIVLIASAGVFGPQWHRAAVAWLRPAAALLGLAGACLMLGAALGLGRQLTPFPKPIPKGGVKQDGVYRFARHPIYGGVLLVGLAWAMLSSPLAFVPWALAVVFLDAKRRREEAWLLEQEPDYAAYCRRVRRRFVPFVW